MTFSAGTFLLCNLAIKHSPSLQIGKFHLLSCVSESSPLNSTAAVTQGLIYWTSLVTSLIGL